MESVELFAVDPGGRRAVLHIGERWYVVSQRREWHPLDVGPEQALSLSAFMTPVRQRFGTFGRAISEVLRLCAGDSPSLAETSSWEERLQVLIRRFSPLLDQLFEGRRCSKDTSFRLSLECFLRLFELGPVEDDEDARWLLCRLASELAPDVCADAGPPEEENGLLAPSRPLNALDGWRLRRVLRETDILTLRCLRFHFLGHGHQETAWLMRLSIDDVRIRLVQLAVKLGRSAEQLRSPDLMEACIQEIQSR